MRAQTQQQVIQTRLFLIDAATAEAGNVTAAVNDMPGVIHVERPNPYREDPMYCQLVVLTSTEMSEDQLDSVLYARNLDYVGVVEMTRH